MDEQRLERALRQGPPFASGYVPHSLALDAQPVVRGPVSVGRLALIIAVTALLLVGMLAGLAALGWGPTPPEEPSVDLGIFEPVAGRIVYGDPRGIWGVDPAAPADLASRVQLSSEAGTPLGWSSDGTRLLIARDDNLFVLDADGSQTQVTGQPMPNGGAILSPDGSRIVFAAENGLYAVDADGGPTEMLLHQPPHGVAGLTFSPDGTQIAYVAWGRGDSEHPVWLMDADGSDAHQIVANDVTLGGGHVRGHGLAWSPDGDRIALSLEESIYTFAPDGSGFTRLIDGVSPYWSPDGSQIAYLAGFQVNFTTGSLAIADADGSNVLTFGFGASGPWHPGSVGDGAGG